MKKYIATKKRSRERIEIIPEPDDPWFYSVNYIKNKTNDKKCDSYITENDIEDWLEILQNTGYTIEKIDLYDNSYRF